MISLVINYYLEKEIQIFQLYDSNILLYYYTGLFLARKLIQSENCQVAQTSEIKDIIVNIKFDELQEVNNFRIFNLFTFARKSIKRFRNKLYFLINKLILRVTDLHAHNIINLHFVINMIESFLLFSINCDESVSKSLRSSIIFCVSF